MTQTSHGAHRGPYPQLTADAARDLRRPIAAAEVRFKVQAVRWTGRGQVRARPTAKVVTPGEPPADVSNRIPMSINAPRPARPQAGPGMPAWRWWVPAWR